MILKEANYIIDFVIWYVACLFGIINYINKNNEMK